MSFLFKRLQMRSGFRFIIIFINLLIIFYIIVYFTFKQEERSNNIPRTVRKIPMEKDTDFSCHYLKENDALPVIDKTVTFPPDSIFFIESSCKPLTSRQACSIESAARSNPDRQVNVLFTSPITWDKFKSSIISTLLSINNVEAARIQLETYAEDTPLYSKFRVTPLSRDDLNVDLGDILKYLTIYKYNGIYLALDVIVARSFKDLKENWVVKQSPAAMSSDMFSFSNNMSGKTLADIALNILVSDLAKTDYQQLWSFDGDRVMKKLMSIWCLTADVQFQNSKTCPDVQVHEPENFYPISFHDRQMYFSPGDWTKWKERKIYTYQTWDRFTKYNIVDKKSLYVQIAKEYCPTIYNFYGATFGIL